MSQQPACVQPAYHMITEITFRLVGNLIVIGALPFRLGLMGAPLWYLPFYALIAGLMLTVAEDLRFAQALFQRKDVRSYAQVRIALVAIIGTAPFVAGMAMAL